MGGGGGPLAFLNKKTWHTGSLRVMEEVWKREQEHEKEMRQIEELKKQKAEERQLEEMERVAEEAGHTRKKDCLGWMYQGGIAAKGEAERRQQEAEAMSKPVQLEENEQAVSKADHVSLLPSFYTEDTPKSANEAWARLNNDPLFMIKRQEQAALQKIRSNPVQMDAIKKDVRKLKADVGSKKSKKHKREKKEKRERKEKEKKKRRSVSASPDGERRKKRKADEIEGNTDRDRRYGLSARLDSHQHHEASQRASETRQRLEEAAKRKEEAARESAKGRHRREEYRTGRLTEGEKRRRLEEMQSNAEKVQATRNEKLHRARQRDAHEEKQVEFQRSRQKPKDFARDTANALYSGGGRSLEDNVMSRRHYSQRGRDADRHV
ncbi:hypothetical protein BSKO_07042 [Bryopsis sp. KO-2023]|nr:hypothetical protein BSKO_07042 [Bryopsis sp. KO-2023]